MPGGFSIVMPAELPRQMTVLSYVSLRSRTRCLSARPCQQSPELMDGMAEAVVLSAAVLNHFVEVMAPLVLLRGGPTSSTTILCQGVLTWCL